MQLNCLMVASLLLFSAVVIVRIVKSTIADRSIRRGWQLNAVVIAFVAAFELYYCLFNHGTELTLIHSFIPVVLSGLLVTGALLLKKTIEYLKEVNTINGIKVYDPVSGAFNRIYLEQRLDTEVARCHRYGSPLGVVAVEIKDFIQLNDEYGHQGSSIASNKIARRLKTLLRETDVVASFSAGRFVLVLPDTPEGSLAGLVNRLRSAIDGMIVIDGAGKENSVKVNVLFGTSYCELKTRNGQELIHKAFSSSGQESPYDYLTGPVANETIRPLYIESKAALQNRA